MTRYIIRRLLMFIPIVLGVSIIVQVLIDIAPGDPARMLAGLDPEPGQYELIREQLRLDDPIYVRYGLFLSNAMKGNLGTSFYTKRPVFQDIIARWPYTVILAALSVLFSTLIGIPLGIFAATHQYKVGDSAAVLASLITVSMPSFWFALLLVQFFAVRMGILPVSGIADWKGWVLPIISLSLGYTAFITRQMRSDILEIVRQDFITTARSKGLSERKVLYKHALKNALIPVVQIIGGLFGFALGGALVAEMIFSLPGLGMYTLTGIQNRDYPAIQGSVMFLSLVFCTVILLIDIAFAFIDPRIRAQFVRRRKRTPNKEEA